MQPIISTGLLDTIGLGSGSSGMPTSGIEIAVIGGILVGLLAILVLFVLIANAYKPKRKMRDWTEEEDRPVQVGESYSEETVPIERTPTKLRFKQNYDASVFLDEEDVEDMEVPKGKKEEKPIKPTASGKTETKKEPEEEEPEEVADETVKKIDEYKKIKPTKKEEKRLDWIQKRRKYRNTKLKKLEKKQFKEGLNGKEKIKKKMYATELQVFQEEILKNPAFIKELGKKAEWAFKQAKKGKTSEEIRKKLEKEKYTEQEIKLIREAFKLKKAKLN